MIYLYLWNGDGEEASYDAILHDDKYYPSPNYYSKIGPYETVDNARSAWVLLGRNTKFFTGTDSFHRHLKGIIET